MKFGGKEHLYDFCGKPAWERLLWASMTLMRRGCFGGKAQCPPEMFQNVQTQLVAMRDPTLRAEWDGNRCYLRVGVCGRELVVHMREDLAEDEFELDEKAMVAR